MEKILDVLAFRAHGTHYLPSLAIFNQIRKKNPNQIHKKNPNQIHKKNPNKIHKKNPNQIHSW